MSKSRKRRRRPQQQSARQKRDRGRRPVRMEIAAVDAQAFIDKRVEHGARLVDGNRELFDKAETFWRINAAEDLVSELSVECQEFMAFASRNAGRAVEVLDRSGGGDDHHLSTALKKYVEDTGQALKEIDNRLRMRGSSLSALFPELPDDLWRDLIARRAVIAHRLLSIDDKRVHKEADRDFRDLYGLIRRIEFAPVIINMKTGAPPGLHLKGSVLRELPVVRPGQQPQIGDALIVVFEVAEGFRAFRLGRTNDDTLAIATSHPGEFNISLHKVQLEGDGPSSVA